MAKGRRGGRNKNKNKSVEASGELKDSRPSPAQTVVTEVIPKKKHVVKGNEPSSVTMKHRSQSFRSHHEKVPQGSSGDGILSSKGSSKKLSALQDRMRAKLEGAKFRMLNETLYTTTGNEAFKSFSQDPSLFDIYHRGYREQVEKWPENPLTLIIHWINERYPESVIADFGCGDAVLSQQLTPKKCKVHSFDLVSVNERVTACDMAHVPLQSNTCDIAVFCLSLMGTNLIDYLIEAKRVLKKPTGVLKIAEVRSRIDGMEGGMGAFIAQVCRLGFKCVHKDKRNKLFLLFEFTFNEKNLEKKEMTANSNDKKDRSEKKKKKKNTDNDQELTQSFVVPPCIYKRR